MEYPNTFVLDISPKKQNVSLQARVLVTWHQPAYGNIPESMECILLDQQSQRIQASIKHKKWIEHFKNVVHDGATILLYRFAIATNGSQYAITNHPYKLLLVGNTVVNPISNYEGPVNGFRFASFADIVAKELKDKANLDIIGSIVSLGDAIPFEKNGVPTKRITVYLNDLEGTSVRCTLFGKFAENLDELLAKSENTKHAILIVQFAKINEYSGDISVTNAYYGTKLFLNDDLPEINDFRQQLLQCPGGEPSFAKMSAATSAYSTISKEDDFFIGCEHIPLSEYMPSKLGKFVTLATIDSIHHEEDWWYSACKNHNKKPVELDEEEKKQLVNYGNGLKCPTCGPNPPLTARFKLHVRVINDSGSTSFTLFERHVRRLIGFSANELRKRHLDDDSIPDALNLLIGKQLLFQVDITSYNNTFDYQKYTVNAYSEDVSLINKFKQLYNVDVETPVEDGLTFGFDATVDDFQNNKESILASAISATGDNTGVVDLIKSTADSPSGKRGLEEIGTEPTSVKSSSNKARKRLTDVKLEE